MIFKELLLKQIKPTSLEDRSPALINFHKHEMDRVKIFPSF